MTMLTALVLAAATPGAFTYTYPAQVRAVPALKARLDAEAAGLRRDFRRDAAADARDAATDKRPFHGWTLDKTWKVVTDTPRFLSLSAETWSYSGGAHGNTGYDALVWDKTRRQVVKPVALFAGAAALKAAIQQPFCVALDRQREEKRGEPVKRGEMFGECIDPTKSTIIIGSTNRRTVNRIGVLIGPYEAGPYAEGVYDVTLPVTRAVLATVRPEYRTAFSVR